MNSSGRNGAHSYIQVQCCECVDKMALYSCDIAKNIDILVQSTYVSVSHKPANALLVPDLLVTSLFNLDNYSLIISSFKKSTSFLLAVGILLTLDVKCLATMYICHSV